MFISISGAKMKSHRDLRFHAALEGDADVENDDSSRGDHQRFAEPDDSLKLTRDREGKDHHADHLKAPGERPSIHRGFLNE